MPKKQRRVLTPHEISKIEAWSAIRLPQEQMASLLGMCRTELNYASKRQPEVRRALDTGRAQASHNVRVTLYEMAVGKRNENGTYKRPPEFQALKFWCETQEGFKREQNITQIGVVPNPAKAGGDQPSGTQVHVYLPDNGREEPKD